MSSRVECARCHHVVQINDQVSERWLTCPRCLASIPNPQLTEAPAPLMTAVLVCGDCGKPVESSWVFCPFCKARCQPSGRPPRGPSVDQEVRRDNKGTVICLIVLGALGVVGVVAFLASGGMDLVKASKDGPLVFLLGLGVLIMIGVGVGVLMNTGKSPTQKVLAGALGGVAMGATVALTVVLLIIFAIFAAIANILDTCAKCGK